MPMGIVSDKDFDLEKSKISPAPSAIPIPKPTAEIVDVTRGRPQGAIEVPNGLRKLIGETSEIDGRQEAVELARQFGISPSSVSAYAHGATSTASYDKQPNQPHIDDAKKRVSTRARAKLMRALQAMTPEKLDNAKVGELAVVARSMSAIVKDMEPEVPKSPNGGIENKGPTFIFYSPQPRKEDHYEMVRANE